MILATAAERIPSGSNVVVDLDGRAHVAGLNARGGHSMFVGVAVEDIREGFRVLADENHVREDDA